MSRSVVLILSSITEEHQWTSDKDLHYFLAIAFGSGAELET
jgi:hypothetical protein